MLYIVFQSFCCRLQSVQFCQSYCFHLLIYKKYFQTMLFEQGIWRLWKCLVAFYQSSKQIYLKYEDNITNHRVLLWFSICPLEKSQLWTQRKEIYCGEFIHDSFMWCWNCPASFCHFCILRCMNLIHIVCNLTTKYSIKQLKTSMFKMLNITF